MPSLARLATFAGLISSAMAATAADWRSQSIYFLLTDRFARTDNSTTYSCDTTLGVCEIDMGTMLGVQALIFSPSNIAVVRGRVSSTR